MKLTVLFLFLATITFAQTWPQVNLIPQPTEAPTIPGSVCWPDLGTGTGTSTFCLNGPGYVMGQNMTASAPFWTAPLVGTSLSAAQDATNLTGAFMLFKPITYNPYSSATQCKDSFGNIVSQPVPSPGYPAIGPNDLLIWNGLSANMPSSGACGAPLTIHEDWGLFTNGYFSALGGLNSTNPSFAAVDVVSQDGLITGGMSAANWYSGAIYPGNINLVSYQDADSVHGFHFNSNTHSAGNGYNIGDTWYIVCSTTNAQGKVLTLTGGAGSGVATYSITAPGNGCTFPASNVATTNIVGSGSGFTVNAVPTIESFYIGGAIYVGHSCGPPTPSIPIGSATILNSTNPLANGLGYQQGLIYYDDCLHTFRGLQDDLVTWTAIPGSGGSGTPGGPQYAIQINNPVNTFAGYSTFYYTPTTGVMTITGLGSGIIVGDTSTSADDFGVVNVSVGPPIGSGSPHICPGGVGYYTFQNSDGSWYADCKGNLAGQTISLGVPITGVSNGTYPFQAAGSSSQLYDGYFSGLKSDSRVMFANQTANSTSNTETAEFDLEDTSGQQFAAEIETGFSTVTHSSRTSFMDFFLVNSASTYAVMAMTPTGITLGTSTALAIPIAGDYQALVFSGKNSGANMDLLTIGSSGASGATYGISLAETIANLPTSGANAASIYLNTSNQLVATINGVAASQICTMTTGCGGGGGSIGGTIASPQVAYGSGVNTIAGTSNFEWSANTLTVQGASAAIVVGDGTNLGLIDIDAGSSCSAGNAEIQDSGPTWYIDCKGNFEGQSLGIASGSGVTITPGANLFEAVAQTASGNAAVPMILYSFNNDGTKSPNPTFQMYGSRGTFASPSAVASGDTIGGFSSRGYNGSAFSNPSAALMVFKTTQNWTHSAQGTEIEMDLTPSGSTTRQAVLYLDTNNLQLQSGTGITVDGGSGSFSSGAILTAIGAVITGTSATSLQVTGVGGGVAADIHQVGNSGGGSAQYALTFVKTPVNPSTAGGNTATLYLSTTNVLEATINGVAAGQVCLSTTPSCGLAAGPASVQGTANEVLINGGTSVVSAGAALFTLPQAIATSSAPTFADLILSSLNTSSVVFTNGSKALTTDPYLSWNDSTFVFAISPSAGVNSGFNGAVFSSWVTGTNPAFVANGGSATIYGNGNIAGQQIGLGPITYSALTATMTCNSSNEGYMAEVTDANTTTFNSTLSGGGTNHMLVRCNKVNWVIS